MDYIQQQQQPQQQQPQQQQPQQSQAGGTEDKSEVMSAIQEVHIDQEGTQNESNELNNSQTTMEGGAVVMKIPNSYKYPLLKRYYEFGPWIGRNRKAICVGCRLQTSSSQPDRLLKHLNRCTALSEADKVAVTDLMNERTANKRKKPVSIRLKGDNDTESYYGDEQGGDELSGHNSISIPSGGLKRVRREHGDKNGQIDDALTRFIMTCRIPLKAIHSPEFIEFVRSLNPDYHIPSRETITTELIPSLLNIL